MDKPYIVDFGGGEERWQDAELGKKWSTWIETQKKQDEQNSKLISGYQKLSDKYYKNEAAVNYNTEIIQRYLDENPNTAIFEPDSDESIETDDRLIRSHFDLSPKDVITPQQRNYALAWRLARGYADENEPFLNRLDTRYNRQTIEEDKAWEAAKAKIPQTAPDAVYRPTSPSRLQSLGVFGQQIDPNVPMFLQKANPHIPWGVNHPLKKAYREYALTRRATQSREDYEADFMDRLNTPSYLESNLYPDEDTTQEPYSWLKDTATEVKKWGYTPHLIDKMQTERQKELLRLYQEVPPDDE